MATAHDMANHASPRTGTLSGLRSKAGQIWRRLVLDEQSQTPASGTPRSRKLDPADAAAAIGYAAVTLYTLALIAQVALSY